MFKYSFLLTFFLAHIISMSSVWSQTTGFYTEDVSNAQIGVQPKLSTSKTNPALSINALFLGRANSKGQSVTSEATSGFQVQEIEARYTSNIDSYFRGDIVLAIEKEPGEDFALEPEEAFVETLSVPSVTIRAGKFYTLFGRHNYLHTHNFPFIDAPLVNERLLGEEGLNQVGVAAAVLLPTSWYSEFIFQGLSAGSEIFRTDSANALVGVYQYKNLWDLSDYSTLEFILGYGHGENDFSATTTLYDAAAIFKWRRSKESSFSLTAEYMGVNQNGAPSNSQQSGFVVWSQYQFNNRYWIQARADYVGNEGAGVAADRKYSALVGYIPTEYSAIRLQYDYLNEGAEDAIEHRLALQLNVSLGTHPAHSY